MKEPSQIAAAVVGSVEAFPAGGTRRGPDADSTLSPGRWCRPWFAGRCAGSPACIVSFGRWTSMSGSRPTGEGGTPSKRRPPKSASKDSTTIPAVRRHTRLPAERDARPNDDQDAGVDDAAEGGNGQVLPERQPVEPAA